MKNYKCFEDIINDKNLLFDIKNDLIFRNVFLNKCSFNYICKLLHYLLGYDLKDLKSNLKLVNNEHPSDSAFSSINRSDIIYDYKGTYIIFEMNFTNKKHHIYKNYYYLFKQHSSRLNNKNNYINKTILINFDDYDVNKKHQIVYKSKILDTEYYTNIYNLINILHINLDSLSNKVYNNDKLSNLEKLLIIFVEQNKSNLFKKNVESEVINIMDYIARMDFREGDPVTYNSIEEAKIRNEILEECERKFANKKKQFEIREQQFKTREQQFETREQQFETRTQQFETREQQFANEKQQLEEEKISFAKALKAEGYPISKIYKLTKLPKSKIMML